MQMSPKTPHKALQTEAASSASIALYSQPSVLRVKGKGPHAFFHVGWKGVCLGGGVRQSLRVQGLGAAHVQWLVQNQPEGAKAQGTPHL